jgi:hypothetical protein
MSKSTDEERSRLNQELAQMFEQLQPILDELSAITRRARAENWDMERYKSARAALQDDKARIGKRIEAHQVALEALDQLQ